MKIKVTTVDGVYEFSSLRMVAHSILSSEDRRQVVEAVRFFEESSLKPCDIHHTNGTIVSFPNDNDEGKEMDDVADGMEVYKDLGYEEYEPNPYDGTYSED